MTPEKSLEILKYMDDNNYNGETKLKVSIQLSMAVQLKRLCDILESKL